MLQKRTMTGLAVGALLASAVSASAATVSIDGGTGGVIPGGAASNEALAALGLSDPLSGFYGSTIKLSGPAKVTYTLLGAEAGFNNTFTSGTDSFSGGNGVGGTAGSFSSAGFDSFMAIAGAGNLNFSFSTDGPPAGSVANGSNPMNTPGFINFFASIVGDATGTSGQSVYLFFDDDGAGSDDNHDDLVVRVDISAVPLPAAGFLLFGALGGLAALRRRRKAA